MATTPALATPQKLTFSLILDKHHSKLSFPPFLSKSHKLSAKFTPVAFNATPALYTHSASHKLFTPIRLSRPNSTFFQMGSHEACSSREISVKSSFSESGATSTLSQTVLGFKDSVFYFLQAIGFQIFNFIITIMIVTEALLVSNYSLSLFK
jgi:hypothetical protein